MPAPRRLSSSGAKARIMTATFVRRMALVTTLALVLWATPAAATADHSNGTTGNYGTIKVQDDSDTGNHSNDPHVGCSFSIEGFGMAAASGNLTIKAWPPTGDHDTVVLDSTWTSTETDAHGNHFVEGPLTLESGHYKVYASNTDGHAKTKVFWVDCPQAEVPVFPTVASVTLAGLGSVGGAMLLLQRKK